jgi:hypothetical protein
MQIPNAGLELLGHRDVSTTMIYTHILNRGGRGVQSPADRLLKIWKRDAASGIDCGPIMILAITLAAIAGKRGFDFRATSERYGSTSNIASRVELFGIGGQQRRGLNGSLNS